MKKILLIGIAAGSIAPCMANAQTAPAPGSEDSLAEVVVTAQRREQRLQDVPISIVAVSGAVLDSAHLNTGNDLNMVAPGLNYSIQGSYAQPTIRGIGSSIVGPGADANVALYIDGVYQASETANVFEFNDIDRVEILEGPQGTLFGRNATGGAIRIITRDPSFTPSADISYSYGSFHESKVTLYADTPVSSTVAVNFAALYDHDDGYIRDVATNSPVAQNTVAGFRLKVLFQPNDDLKFILGGNYSDTKNNTGYALRVINGYSVYAGPPFFAQVNACSYCATVGIDPQLETVVADTHLTATWNVASGKVTSITAYQNVQSRHDTINVDETPLDLADSVFLNPAHEFTQEFDYVSDYKGPLNWSGGLYFIRSLGSVDPFDVYSPAAGPVFYQDTTVTTDAYAAFGEVYYDLTHDLHLIAGVRYSDEHKTEYQNTADVYGILPGGAPLALPDYSAKASWNAWTPRLSARYDLNDESNVYATFSRGFKSGIFQPAGNFTAATSPAVAPETVNAYEIGYKLAQRTFSLNASVYYYAYDNLQVSQVTDQGGALLSTTTNARSATIKGAELQSNFVITQNWKLTAGAAYTHAIYNDFQGAPLYAPTWYNPGTKGFSSTYATGDLLDGLTQVTLPGGGVPSADGKRLIRAPEVTTSVALNYSHPLFGGKIDGSATTAYSSGFYWDPQNTLRQPAYTLLNATLGWLAPSERYRVSIWGTNLTNKQYYLFAQSTSTGNAGVLARPRSVGGQINFYFK
jgi:iron complex outermembrane recepter protein